MDIRSDCPNPQLNHTIDLSFHQATLIRQVSIFIDFFQDESYTPKTIVIRGGTTYRDLQVINSIDFASNHVFNRESRNWIAWNAMNLLVGCIATLQQ